MSRFAKSLLISSAVHLLIAWLVLAISNSVAHLNKTVVIDFTLLDSLGSSPAGKTKNAGQLPRDSIKHGNSENTPSPGVNSRSRIADSIPIPSKQTPAPATEPARTAPVATAAPASPPKQAAPSHGSVSGRSGKEAGGGGPISGRVGGNGVAGTGRGQATSGISTGSSTEQLRKKYLAEQFEYIKKLIEKNIKYPARALRMGWTGRVLVSFTILESGHVANMKIISSSGYDLLDENILDTIKMVEPFPKPPVSALLKIPFDYRTEHD